MVESTIFVFALIVNINHQKALIKGLSHITLIWIRKAIIQILIPSLGKYIAVILAFFVSMIGASQKALV